MKIHRLHLDVYSFERSLSNLNLSLSYCLPLKITSRISHRRHCWFLRRRDSLAHDPAISGKQLGILDSDQLEFQPKLYRRPSLDFDSGRVRRSNLREDLVGTSLELQVFRGILFRQATSEKKREARGRKRNRRLENSVSSSGARTAFFFEG